MIRTDKRVRLCVCLLVAVLVFIWGNSLLPGEVSGALSDWVHGMLTRLFSGGNGSAFGGRGLLRKIAHFTEFCALGLCLGWLFGMKGKSMRLPLALGAAVACADEALQLLVPERGPAILDVCIDTAGVATGIALLLFGHSFIHKVKFTQSGGKSI